MIVFDFGRIFASKFSGKFKYQMTDISVGWLKMSTETQATIYFKAELLQSKLWALVNKQPISFEDLPDFARQQR